jgi:hypothetical protein
MPAAMRAEVRTSALARRVSMGKVLHASMLQRNVVPAKAGTQ